MIISASVHRGRKDGGTNISSPSSFSSRDFANLIVAAEILEDE